MEKDKGRRVYFVYEPTERQARTVVATQITPQVLPSDDDPRTAAEEITAGERQKRSTAAAAALICRYETPKS